MRVWWLIGLVVWGFSLMPAKAQDAALRERFRHVPLRWGGDAEGGAPYQLRDPQQPRRVIGFEVELADAVCEALSKQLGVDVRPEFVQYDWTSLIPGLEKGDFDVIISGLEITPANRQRVLFTRPYYVYAQQLVVRRDEQVITRLADCRDRPVATLAGTAAERMLHDAGVANIQTYDGQVEPYLELEFGRVDAVLLDLPIVTFYAAPNPDLKLVGPPLGRGLYGIGVRPQDTALAAALNAALGELIESGRLRDIDRRWHLWNQDQVALAVEPRRDAELNGLGFTLAGLPRPESELPPVEMVDRNLMTASAQLWTFDRYAPLLVDAALTTVGLTVASMAVAVVLGLIVSLCRLYGPAPLRALALAYVEFFRGIPLLLLLMVMYYGLASLGLKMPAVVTAIVGFGLTYAAYEAEIYRSSILAVSPGQWEAARALGMSDPLAFRRIVLPQALRTALGPMTNDFVALFKDTSLVSVIAVRELTKEYEILARSSGKFVELGILTAVLYLAMSVPLGHLSRWLESRTSPRP